eukprot:Clim_evm18s208 gene=Clim_evmTU18s208
MGDAVSGFTRPELLNALLGDSFTAGASVLSDVGLGGEVQISEVNVLAENTACDTYANFCPPYLFVPSAGLKAPSVSGKLSQLDNPAGNITAGNGEPLAPTTLSASLYGEVSRNDAEEVMLNTTCRSEHNASRVNFRQSVLTAIDVDFLYANQLFFVPLATDAMIGWSIDLVPKALSSVAGLRIVFEPTNQNDTDNGAGTYEGANGTYATYTISIRGGIVDGEEDLTTLVQEHFLHEDFRPIVDFQGGARVDPSDNTEVFNTTYADYGTLEVSIEYKDGNLVVEVLAPGFPDRPLAFLATPIGELTDYVGNEFFLSYAAWSPLASNTTLCPIFGGEDNDTSGFLNFKELTAFSLTKDCYPATTCGELVSYYIDRTHQDKSQFLAAGNTVIDNTTQIITMSSHGINAGNTRSQLLIGNSTIDTEDLQTLSLDLLVLLRTDREHKDRHPIEGSILLPLTPVYGVDICAPITALIHYDTDENSSTGLSVTLAILQDRPSIFVREYGRVVDAAVDMDSDSSAVTRVTGDAPAVGVSHRIRLEYDGSQLSLYLFNEDNAMVLANNGENALRLTVDVDKGTLLDVLGRTLALGAIVQASPDAFITVDIDAAEVNIQRLECPTKLEDGSTVDTNQVSCDDVAWSAELADNSVWATNIQNKFSEDGTLTLMSNIATGSSNLAEANYHSYRLRSGIAGGQFLINRIFALDLAIDRAISVVVNGATITAPTFGADLALTFHPYELFSAPGSVILEFDAGAAAGTFNVGIRLESSSAFQRGGASDTTPVWFDRTFELGNTFTFRLEFYQNFLVATITKGGTVANDVASILSRLELFVPDFDAFFPAGLTQPALHVLENEAHADDVTAAKLVLSKFEVQSSSSACASDSQLNPDCMAPAYNWAKKPTSAPFQNAGKVNLIDNGNAMQFSAPGGLARTSQIFAAAPGFRNLLISSEFAVKDETSGEEPYGAYAMALQPDGLRQLSPAVVLVSFPEGSTTARLCALTDAYLGDLKCPDPSSSTGSIEIDRSSVLSGNPITLELVYSDSSQELGALLYFTGSDEYIGLVKIGAISNLGTAHKLGLTYAVALVAEIDGPADASLQLTMFMNILLHNDCPESLRKFVYQAASGVDLGFTPFSADANDVIHYDSGATVQSMPLNFLNNSNTNEYFTLDELFECDGLSTIDKDTGSLKILPGTTAEEAGACRVAKEIDLSGLEYGEICMLGKLDSPDMFADDLLPIFWGAVGLRLRLQDTTTERQIFFEVDSYVNTNLDVPNPINLKDPFQYHSSINVLARDQPSQEVSTETDAELLSPFTPLKDSTAFFDPQPDSTSFIFQTCGKIEPRRFVVHTVLPSFAIGNSEGYFNAREVAGDSREYSGANTLLSGLNLLTVSAFGQSKFEVFQLSFSSSTETSRYEATVIEKLQTIDDPSTRKRRRSRRQARKAMDSVFQREGDNVNMDMEEDDTYRGAFHLKENFLSAWHEQHQRNLHNTGKKYRRDVTCTTTVHSDSSISDAILTSLQSAADDEIVTVCLQPGVTYIEDVSIPNAATATNVKLVLTTDGSTHAIIEADTGSDPALIIDSPQTEIANVIVRVDTTKAQSDDSIVIIGAPSVTLNHVTVHAMIDANAWVGTFEAVVLGVHQDIVISNSFITISDQQAALAAAESNGGGMTNLTAIAIDPINGGQTDNLDGLVVANSTISKGWEFGVDLSASGLTGTPSRLVTVSNNLFQDVGTPVTIALDNHAAISIRGNLVFANSSVAANVIFGGIFGPGIAIDDALDTAAESIAIFGNAFLSPQSPLIENNLAAQGIDVEPQVYCNYLTTGSPDVATFYNGITVTSLSTYLTNSGACVTIETAKLDTCANVDSAALSLTEDILEDESCCVEAFMNPINLQAEAVLFDGCIKNEATGLVQCTGTSQDPAAIRLLTEIDFREDKNTILDVILETTAGDGDFNLQLARTDNALRPLPIMLNVAPNSTVTCPNGALSLSDVGYSTTIAEASECVNFPSTDDNRRVRFVIDPLGTRVTGSLTGEASDGDFVADGFMTAFYGSGGGVFSITLQSTSSFTIKQARIISCTFGLPFISSFTVDDTTSGTASDTFVELDSKDEEIPVKERPNGGVLLSGNSREIRTVDSYQISDSVAVRFDFNIYFTRIDYLNRPDCSVDETRDLVVTLEGDRGNNLELLRVSQGTQPLPSASYAIDASTSTTDLFGVRETITFGGDESTNTTFVPLQNLDFSITLVQQTTLSVNSLLSNPLGTANANITTEVNDGSLTYPLSIPVNATDVGNARILFEADNSDCIIANLRTLNVVVL